MARTTERPARSRRRVGPAWWWWIAGPLVAVGVVAGVYVVRSRGSNPSAVANDPGVTHVHGLGINPADGDLYAATHMGVFHIAKDGQATRIADRFQDTMGFTVAGPDHFIASGHPDLSEELPPLLGLIESKDAARTWEKRSLLGKSDFHALRYAHDTIYGYDSSHSAFMVSRDGRTWDTRSKTTLGDFAVSPEDEDLVIATTPGGLERSDDGGRTWKEIEGPAQTVLIDWSAGGDLWVVDAGGRVHQSIDDAESWALQGRVAGQPEAFHAARDSLYLAADRAIYVSRDEGKKWTVFFREDEGH